MIRLVDIMRASVDTRLDLGDKCGGANVPLFSLGRQWALKG